MIKDGSNPARADDHYNRWREDADSMAGMGLQVYRMGIEWARLCPREGEVNKEAVAHYREEISYLRDKGIPVLFFFTGAHADYHRPSDTADKINSLGILQISGLATDIIRALGEFAELESGQYVDGIDRARILTESVFGTKRMTQIIDEMTDALEDESAARARDVN